MKLFSPLLLALIVVLTTAPGCGGDDVNGDDTGTRDISFTDTTIPDTAEQPDTIQPDSLVPDTNNPDINSPDMGPVDTGTPDEGPTDQGNTEDTKPTGPPEVGDHVPDFSLPTHRNTTFTLSANLGKYVLVSSFPAAETSVCEWQNNYIRDNATEFESRNVIPVGLSTDGVEKLAGWATAKGYTHDLLSDATPHGELSRELGLFSAVNWVTSRALFLVDPEGKLAYKVVYAMGTKPDYQALLDFIDSQTP